MSTDSHVRARLSEVLDGFHAAAAAADEEQYLVCLAPSAVFLGTDPDERWVGDELRSFVHRNFSRGQGWTYTVESRSLDLALDGRTAWFDERLRNDWYGECRGTGVLQDRDGDWKIEQYSLSIPIPNSVAERVLATIGSAR